MEGFAAEVKDLVNRLVSDYHYWAQLESTQALVEVQRQFWRHCSTSLPERSPEHPESRQELYRLLDEAGAVPCPYEIYNLFARLYLFERQDEQPAVQLRDRAEFEADRWLLFTQSTNYQLTDVGGSYHLHVLLGFNVQISDYNPPVLGGRRAKVDKRPLMWPNLRKLGNVCQMRSAISRYSDHDRYYASMNSVDKALRLYGYTI